MESKKLVGLVIISLIAFVGKLMHEPWVFAPALLIIIMFYAPEATEYKS